jgi:hypothetical protein
MAVKLGPGQRGRLVGTSRYDVPARVQRAERSGQGARIASLGCAERGADSAARHLYHRDCAGHF